MTASKHSDGKKEQANSEGQVESTNPTQSGPGGGVIRGHLSLSQYLAWGYMFISCAREEGIPMSWQG